MLRADREGLAHPEGQKLPTLGFVLLVVDLVDDQEHRSLALANPACGRRILFDGPGHGVHHQEHQIRVLECLVGLVRDLVFERVARLEPTARVDHVKGHAAPLDFDGLAVARDAALFFNDRHALSGETIHE